jgi:phytoene dehydrogenase-like protein
VDLECGGASLTLRGRRLIVSAQWEKLELLLPGRRILPRPNRRFASIRPAAYPFCLHMGVHEGGLPESMASCVVVLRDGTGPVTNRDLVFLQTSLPGENDRAPAGRRAVSATVYLADSPLRLSDQELKDAAAKIIDSLEEFLPFLRDSIDYLRVDQSIFLSRRYQETASRKYRARRRPFFGMSTLSPQTRLSNVLLTGGILRAGLGFEGEIIAGMDAAFRAEKGN